MELVQDVYASLDDSMSVSIKRSHYEVLGLCAGTLGILLVQALDQPNSCAIEQPGIPVVAEIGVSFVDVVVKLLDSRHPVNFRASFSRVVPSVSTLVVLAGNFDLVALIACCIVVLPLDIVATARIAEKYRRYYNQCAGLCRVRPLPGGGGVQTSERDCC